jgi:hypothetical protein
MALRHFGCCQGLAEPQQTTLKVLPGTLTLEHTTAGLVPGEGEGLVNVQFLYPEGRSFTWYWPDFFQVVPPSNIKWRKISHVS